MVVVVSAGNSGAGGTLTGGSGDVNGQLSTITDPGNAAKAITVGSTHRFAPHTYGISDTSSKGPTLDGRLKPDLVAPGERITSAATGALRTGVVPLVADPGIATYIEDSGTSMAAPHVSGAIAAFLSVRSEFVGQPDEVKRLFCENATSLGRHEFYQGSKPARSHARALQRLGKGATMADIAGLPYYELTFTADGALSSDGGLPAAVRGGGITDLFVFSHGWNNSVDSARSLYQSMFTLLAGMLGPKRSTCAAVGVLWPSLLFPEDDPSTPDTPSTGAQLKAGMRARARLPGGSEQSLTTMGTIAFDQRPQDSAQLQQFHQLAAGLVTTPALAPEDEGPQAAITGDTKGTVFGYAAGDGETLRRRRGRAAQSVRDHVVGRAREVLRSMSYYEMKNRPAEA